MKSANNVLKIFFSILPTLLLSTNILLANELESPNFKMIGVSTGGGGGILESSNYSLLSNVGRTSADPRIYSTNYRINQDPSAIFIAAQPGIQCFETDTDGVTDCLSGPQELLDGGMVAICGPGGCYNRARFEIETYVNPGDTLYMIQISEDNFVSDIRCLNGSTFRPKDLSSCDINDFRTQTYWEAEDFNVKGLSPGIEYFIRTTALHGDFTQSDFSTISSATTGTGFIEFDIDIATNTGYEVESVPPYSVSFTGTERLIPGSTAITAPSLVWLDLLSSSVGGVAIIQFGKYGGLYSPTTTETILSQNQDIGVFGSEGFGLQSHYVDYDISSYFGDISATTNYSGTDYMVGEVSTDAKKIYDADGPINNGRMALYLKARASSDRSPSPDYTENIYFIAVPRY